MPSISHYSMIFRNKNEEASASCKEGDFQRGVDLYSELIAENEKNQALFVNRAMAYHHLGNYEMALQDAKRAAEISPRYAKAYYRQGVALKELESYADALVALSRGMCLDGSDDMLTAFKDVAFHENSPVANIENIIYKVEQVESYEFMIMAVAGQQLFTVGYEKAARDVLENALLLTSHDLNFKCNVLSTLASVSWKLKDYQKAIIFMQEDLQLRTHLGDKWGECQAHGNLGNAFYSVNEFHKALDHHRKQNILAKERMNLNPHDIVEIDKAKKLYSESFNNLGSVYNAMHCYQDAINCYNKSIEVLDNFNDALGKARVFGRLGCLHSAIGEQEEALKYHNKHLSIVISLRTSLERNSTPGKMDSQNLAIDTLAEIAEANTNIGDTYLIIRDISSSMTHYTEVLLAGDQLKDNKIMARGYNLLGKCCRVKGSLDHAIELFENSSSIAENTGNKEMWAEAMCEIGITYQQQGEFSKAYSYFLEDFNNGDEYRALGCLGLLHVEMREYEEAFKYFSQQFRLCSPNSGNSWEVYNNLTAICRKLGDIDTAEQYAVNQFSVSGNCCERLLKACQQMTELYNSQRKYAAALDFLTTKLNKPLCRHSDDADCILKVSLKYLIANVYFLIGRFKKTLIHCKDIQRLQTEKYPSVLAQSYMLSGRALLNLGSKRLACSYYERSYIISHSLLDVEGQFEALGWLADAEEATDSIKEALNYRNQQLKIGLDYTRLKLQADAHVAIGNLYRCDNNFSKALHHYKEERNILRRMGDRISESFTLSRMGELCFLQKQYNNCVSIFTEQLSLCSDYITKSHALYNLGHVNFEENKFEEALQYFEEQIAVLNSIPHKNYIIQAEEGRISRFIGECHEAMGRNSLAIQCYETSIKYANANEFPLDEYRATMKLTQLYLKQMNYKLAIGLLDRMKEIVDVLKDDDIKFDVDVLHSQILLNIHDYRRAVQKLNELLSELQLNEGEAICKVTVLLADAYLGLQDFENAVGKYKSAIRTAKEHNLHQEQISACIKLARILQMRGDLVEAITMCRNAHDLAKRENDTLGSFEALYEQGICFQQDDQHKKALSIFEEQLKSVNNVCSLKKAELRYRIGLCYNAMRKVDNAQQNFLQAINVAHTHLNKSSMNAARLSFNNLIVMQYEKGKIGEMFNLCEKYRSLQLRFALMESGISKETLDDKCQFSPVTHVMCTSFVERFDAIVLHYTLVESRLFAFLFKKRENIKCQCVDISQEDFQSINKNFSSIDLLVGFARETLGVEINDALIPQCGISSETESDIDEHHRYRYPQFSPVSKDYSPLERLYRIFLFSLEAELFGNISQDSNNTRLIISIPSLLWLVPFTALECPVNNYLHQLYQLSCCVSLNTLFQKQKLCSSPPFVLYGDAQTADSLGAEIPQFNDITRDFIKESLRENECLHFSSNIQCKGLEVNDGFISPNDIITNGLRTSLISLFPQNDLSHALIEVSIAFLAAGAKAVLFSQWRFSTDLINHLYAGLGQGLTLAAALQRASLILRNMQRPKRDWTGLSILGDGNITLSVRPLAPLFKAICKLLAAPTQEAVKYLNSIIGIAISRETFVVETLVLEERMQNCTGWPDLLTVLGFTFQPSIRSKPALITFIKTCDFNSKLSLTKKVLNALSPIDRHGLQNLGFLCADTSLLFSLRRCMTSAESLLPSSEFTKLGCEKFLREFESEFTHRSSSSVFVKFKRNQTKFIEYSLAINELASLAELSESYTPTSLHSPINVETLNSEASSLDSYFNAPHIKTPSSMPSQLVPSERSAFSRVLPISVRENILSSSQHEFPNF